MSKQLEGLKAIMFDLGGVIIDLHYEKAAKRFAELAGITTQEIGDLLITSPILKLFEVGAISEGEFRSGVCDLLKINIDNQEFDYIWNSLLGEIAIERIQAIRKIPVKTLILSNTNSIHERAFNKILMDAHGLSSLHELIDTVYFSHEMNLRKPDEAIYQEVTKREKLSSDEILFIDDRQDNIEAAQSTGYQVFHNQKINNWLKLF